MLRFFRKFFENLLNGTSSSVKPSQTFVKANGANVQTARSENVNPTETRIFGPTADSFKKREAVNEEIYFRDIERERRRKPIPDSKEDSKNAKKEQPAKNSRADENVASTEIMNDTEA